ncbi:MAG: nucleotidyltransferase family protein [Gemmataceae bacterium]
MNATAIPWPVDIMDRMVRAVEKVRERLHRTTRVLDEAGVEYAVIGGHAVAAWVAKIDEGSVRNTRDVDILVRRSDLEAVKSAMEAEGFIFDNAYGVDFFLDGPNGKPSDGVHLLYAGEKVKDTDPVPSPLLSESERGAAFQVVSLEALVRMKLVSNRDKDRTHLRDMIQLGLIDQTWPAKYPPVLAERLQHVLDTPGG